MDVGGRWFDDMRLDNATKLKIGRGNANQVFSLNLSLLPERAARTCTLTTETNHKDRTKPKMTTPETMQAVAIDSYGGKELLKLRELPIPEMSPTEVLIKVEAAGVGVWDAIVRQGFMKDVAPAAFPLVLGGDGAGTVAAIGA